MAEQRSTGPATIDPSEPDRAAPARQADAPRPIDCGADDAERHAVSRGPGRGGASRQSSFVGRGRGDEGMR